MNPNTIPIIWVGFIGAVPLLLFVGARNPAVFGAIVSFVVVVTYLAPAISRDVAATTTRHDCYCYGWASAESRSCHRSMPVRHDGLNEQFGAK